MSDGHEGGFFETRVPRDPPVPAGPGDGPGDDGQPGQGQPGQPGQPGQGQPGQPGQGQPGESDEPVPDGGRAWTPPAGVADETLFAAFLAARESAMAAPDLGRISPRMKRRIAAFLVAVFLLSLAAGYAASRWVL
jgi:hypothetical protein